ATGFGAVAARLAAEEPAAVGVPGGELGVARGAVDVHEGPLALHGERAVHKGAFQSHGGVRLAKGRRADEPRPEIGIGAQAIVEPARGLALAMAYPGAQVGLAVVLDNRGEGPAQADAHLLRPVVDVV